MTPVDTTATLEAPQTAPPPDATTFKAVATEEAAPHDGKNLLIHIDIGADKATVHCRRTEHVGTHKQRYVLFSANKHCWVVFTPDVFTVNFVELNEGETVRASILDNTHQVQTSFDVRVPPTATTTTPSLMQGPVIVVP